MRDQRMTRNVKVGWELSYLCVVVFSCALHAPFGVQPFFFFRFAHICVSFVCMVHLFSMSSYSCLTCSAEICCCPVYLCFF